MEGTPVYTLKGLEGQLKEFCKHYNFEAIITLPEKKLSHKPKRERICRFCNKAYPETSFKSEAHIIPEFLGNKYLTSDFECDECNSKFSRYENDLKNYLGVLPTITLTKGKKNKPPKFKPPNNSVIASKSDRMPDAQQAIEVFKQGISDNSLKVDFDTGKVNVIFTRHSYIPQNVYKAFLKIGFSIISQSDIINYKEFLDKIHSHRIVAPVSRILQIEFPFDNALDDFSILLFRRKAEVSNVPTHFISMQYQNMIFQYPLPCNILDYAPHANVERILACPPISTEKVEHDIVMNGSWVDLSSIELCKGSEQHMSFDLGINPKDLKGYNPIDKSVVEGKLKPEDIAGFVIVKDQPRFPIKKDDK